MKDHTTRHDTETEHPRGHHGHDAGHDTGHHRDPHHHDEEHHGGHGGRGGGHGGEHGGRGGGPRGRARRGEARYVLLDALRDGPKHGYEIIKSLEERSAGEYVPSPGTVYPTMQYLEDLGQVRSDQGVERRIYHLTEAGQAELEARAEDLAAFWARFGGAATSAASRPEIGFLQEELENLGRTVWSGLRGLADRDDPAKVRLVREAIERCRGEVRGIIAASQEA